jgi:hypothetical protein
MPRRRLVVWRARRSPSGTLIVTSTPRSPAASRTARVIIVRGTGLIAGSPTGRPSPSRVTVPTPVPPRSTTSPSERQATVTVRCAPWVTSGSSPASLTTTAVAATGSTGAPSTTTECTANVCRSPEGNAMSTVAGAVPSRSAVTAALAAADEHAPVVNPVRSARPVTAAAPSPADGQHQHRAEVAHGIDLGQRDHLLVGCPEVLGAPRAVHAPAAATRSRSSSSRRPPL